MCVAPSHTLHFFTNTLLHLLKYLVRTLILFPLRFIPIKVLSPLFFGGPFSLIPPQLLTFPYFLCYLVSMRYLGPTINKMMAYLNYQYGMHLVHDHVKFYGDDGRPMTVHFIRDSYKGKEGKFSNEVYRSSSLIFLCFFLKDCMDYMVGKELSESVDENYAWQRVNRGILVKLKDLKGMYGTD